MEYQETQETLEHLELKAALGKWDYQAHWDQKVLKVGLVHRVTPGSQALVEKRGRKETQESQVSGYPGPRERRVREGCLVFRVPQEKRAPRGGWESQECQDYQD